MSLIIILLKMRSSVLAAFMSLASAAPALLNFSLLGPAFDGIGALSGGGGVTRLLIDYPTPLQDDIMVCR